GRPPRGAGAGVRTLVPPPHAVPWSTTSHHLSLRSRCMDRPTVAGLGGVVLFADHADTLAHWYERTLGLFFTREPGSHEWWSEVGGGPAFAIHQAKHPLGHDRRHCEITWRVTDLDAFLE